MKPTLEQEEHLFSAALARPPEERADFLRQSCGADRALHDRLTALLAQHARAPGFLEERGELSPLTTLGSALLDLPPEDLTGTVIGSYLVKERLGEGGVGVVYRAEQTEPIRRAVALKVVKPGMDTHEVLVRFAAERQALAMMDHPGIARVIEAGATPQGRPYFAMELVAGVPLTAYCDEHRLPPAARLELFRQVCQAVQHAHQKGIIHRDLKPSNLLVAPGAEGVQPKIIDFGVAKATAGRTAADPAVTTVAQFIGTPAYMSPEQVAGSLDLDTRSDIYSLGVLLYELLTGRPPFESRDEPARGLDELRRRIREDEPAAPSVQFHRLAPAAAAAVARARSLAPARLARHLRGELDGIVLHCLEKDPARRYATAHDLGEDIRRHLHHEPVLATAPGRLDRLGKSLRRHRLAYAVGALVFAALAGATAVSSRQAVRATRAEHAAGLQRAKAERAEAAARTEAATSAAISDFLRTDLLAQASPDQQPERDVKLRTVLDRAAARIDGRFAAQPLVEAALRETLGDTYSALGDYAAMQAQLEKTVALRRARLGPDHLETLRAGGKLFSAYRLAAKLDAAEAVGQDTLERLTRTVGADHPLALQLRLTLTKILYRGKYTEAEPLLRASLADARRVLGPEDPVTLGAMSDFTVVLVEVGRLEEARALAEETIAIKRRVLGPEHPQTLPTVINLAAIYAQLGRFGDGRELAGQVHAVRVRLLGAEHPQTLSAAVILANILVGLREFAEAEPLLRTTAGALGQKVGPEHPATLNTRLTLASLCYETRRYAEAETLVGGAHEILLRKFGPGYADTLSAGMLRGRLAAARDDWPAALALLEPVLAAARRTLGPAAPLTLSVTYQLARAHAGAGQAAEAEPLFREAYERRRGQPGAGQAEAVEVAGGFGKFLFGLGRYAEAEPLLRAWHEGLEKMPVAGRPAGTWAVQLAEARAQLAALCTATGRPAEAAQWRP